MVCWRKDMPHAQCFIARTSHNCLTIWGRCQIQHTTAMPRQGGQSGERWISPYHNLHMHNYAWDIGQDIAR